MNENPPSHNFSYYWWVLDFQVFVKVNPNKNISWKSPTNNKSYVRTWFPKVNDYKITFPIFS